jgi:hypothetical protein
VAEVLAVVLDDPRTRVAQHSKVRSIRNPSHERAERKSRRELNFSKASLHFGADEFTVRPSNIA